MKLCFEEGAPLTGVARRVEKGHGRIVRRECRTSQLLQGYSTFPGLHQVIQVRRETTYVRENRTVSDFEYGVTSLAPCDAAAPLLMMLLKRHWSIENKNFHVRDDSRREDRPISHDKTAAFAQHVLLALALNLLRTRSRHWPATAPMTERSEIASCLTATGPQALLNTS